ncbi:succinylglutamate desuccinylase/aspartoacylase family protein [Candidatus Wolfebacteria bacterium]|nr:succinylglutamate desuccinylase/aspartoacylase family protein [Candidatus Wolfebacteria bacterium]
MNIPGTISVMTGLSTGKRLVVMVGTHGNETCGPLMLRERFSEIQIQRGEVIFIEGNPRAIEENVRYIDENLNRMFRAVDSYSAKERESYEFKRAQELKPLLSSCDALLDIHSSGTKDTVPFVICEQNSFEIVKEFPFEIVSYGFDQIEPGGTDTYVNENGGNGICIECGYHYDPKAKDRSWESLKDFLIINGAIDGELNTPRDQMVVNSNYLYKTKVNFRLHKYFADFEEIREGDFIGTDGNEKIHAPKDGLIIFARNREDSGEEAFIVGDVE